MDGYWQDGKYILVSTLQAKYVAERENVKKLEGWLKALVPYIERSGLYDDLIKEVYAYIKAMEGKP